METGQILSGALEIVRARFMALAGLWALYFGFSIIAVIVLAMMIGTMGAAAFAFSDPGSLATLGGGFILTIILFYAAYLLIYLAQAASLTAKASPLQDLPFGEAISAGLRSCLTLLGVTVILLIAYFLGAMLVGLLGAAWGTAANAIVLVLFVPVLVYLGCRLALITPVAAVERQVNPLKVIARSWNLTKGNVLPIFLASLVYLFLLVVLGAVITLPLWGSIQSGSNLGAGLMLYLFFAFAAFGVLLTISWAALVSVMHGQVSGQTDIDFEETFA